MKKTRARAWNRMLALVLCTAMILGAVMQRWTVNVSAAGGVRLESCSLTVSEGALGLNLFVSGLSEAQATSCTLEVDGTSHSLKKQDDGTYLATHYVTPRNILKKLSISLYSGTTKIPLTNSGAVNGTYSYAVKDYLVSQEEKDNAMGRLAKAIDDYGTCAYYYFTGSNTIPVDVKDVDLSSYAVVKSGQFPSSVSYVGSCLVLSDTIAIRHYFNVTAAIDSYELLVDDKPVEIQVDHQRLNENGVPLCYVEISDIRAWSIDHAYLFKATANGLTQTMKYSVLSYAQAATAKNEDPLLCKLVKSIYWYKVAFNECLKELQGGTDPGDDPGEVTTDYVTYRMFGAKGDGKTNDYAAIVATHAYANEKNLPVKADKGAVYYVDKMDKNNPKGAIIKTDTDWSGAEFIIDDSKLEVTWSYDDKDRKTVYYPDDWDGQCFLFTVEPSIVYEKTWVNYNVWWRYQNGKWSYYKDEFKKDGDQHIYIGLDPSIGTYTNSMYLSDPVPALNMLNREFTKNTEKLDGYFGDKALYALKTGAFLRWGRYGSEGASSSLRAQEEVVILDEYGNIDPNSKLQWDWKDIREVQKCHIDEKQLTIKGCKFTTIVNHAFDTAYINRGISIRRSNVLMEGVEHYLAGEEAEYSDRSFGYSNLYKRDDVFPRYGAPYQGFFRLDHCAYVTLKDCVFASHHRVFSKYTPSTDTWSNESSSAPYDYYAEYCVGLTLDHCTAARAIIYSVDYVKGLLGKGPKVEAVCDTTGVLDDLRWGVSGTNYCKDINVINGSEMNRIDAHMGTYNLTVKDSTMGWMGILAVGFGKMHIENVTSYAKYFIKLRDDYGSAWYGDVEIKNCTWKLSDTNCTPRLIYAKYNPTLVYGFDAIDEGKTYPDGTPFLYYSQLPGNVTIDGFTLDGSNVTNSALFSGGLGIFMNPLSTVRETVNEDYFLNKNNTAEWAYKYPLLPTKKVSLKNLTVIKNPAIKATTFNHVVVVPVDNTYHGEYLFKDTVFEYDDKSTKVITAGEQGSGSESGSGSEQQTGTLTYMNSKYSSDMPKAVIVQPESATPEERYSAGLLQKYVEAEDGYKPEIISDAVSKGSRGFEISVGNTNRPHGTAKYSSNDSYSIKSYDGGIAITGVGQLGLMHGAMRFLEACGGYYYLSWNDLYVSNQKHFKYEPMGVDIDYERAFLFTDIDVCFSSINPASDLTDPYYGKGKPSGYEYPRTGRLFSLALGFNGFYADSYCLPQSEAGREKWYLTANKSSQYGEETPIPGLAAGQAHTLGAEFFLADDYFDEHPEWFAAYAWYEEGELKKPDSQRKRTKEQLCPYMLLHDPEAYQIVFRHCQDMIANSYDPNAPIQILSISKNDGDKLCTCSYCMKDRAAHGDSGGLYESVEYVQLLNKISQDLHKDGAYPNLYVDMLAYEWTVEAPPSGITCDDHVIVRFAPIRRCYGDYLDAQGHVTNTKYYNELVNWTKICKHVWIWDYNSNFNTTAGPYANVDVMQHDVKLYKQLGVEGVYLQSNSRHLESNSEFGDVRNYILGRMLQDPSRNYEEELAFITDALYGKAGIYVREYMKHMEKQAKSHHAIASHRDDVYMYDRALYNVYAGVHAWNGQKVINGRMPDEEIGYCEGLWKEINKIAAGESADVQKRLTRLEIGWRLVKSTLNVYEFNDPSTYKQQNELLIKDMKSAGVTYFSAIQGKTINDCTLPQNHPDNWYPIKNPDGTWNTSDRTIGTFTGTNPGGNLSPEIPKQLFVFENP